MEIAVKTRKKQLNHLPIIFLSLSLYIFITISHIIYPYYHQYILQYSSFLTTNRKLNKNAPLIIAYIYTLMSITYL